MYIKSSHARARIDKSSFVFSFKLPRIVIYFFLSNQPDALIIPIIRIYSVIKLHFSGIFSAHHQEFSTVHLTLVSFMQVFDDSFQAESGRNSLEAVIKNLHETYQCRIASRKLLMMGREDARKVQFYNRINSDNWDN
jgi:hypothetical protein